MNINNNYDIIQTPKLIDINGNLTKFASEFKITSDQPYYIAIVNQKMLDNNEIQFRPPEKYSEGSVRYEQNEHLPHYIALKSDQNCKVNVQLKTTPLESPIKLQDYIPKSQTSQPPRKTPIQLEYVAPQQVKSEYADSSDTMAPTTSKKSNIGLIVIIGIIALLFGGVFLFAKRKSGSHEPIPLKPISVPRIKIPPITPIMTSIPAIPSISPSPPSIQAPVPQISQPSLDASALMDSIKSYPIT